MDLPKMRSGLAFLLSLAACMTAVAAPTFSQAVARSSRPLILGQKVTAKLRPGEAESFQISLEAGDYAQMVIHQMEGWIDVAIYDPAGQLVKTVSNNQISAKGRLVETEEMENAGFVALRDGDYRIEAHAVGGPNDVRYSLIYLEHKTMAERMERSPVFHPYESPQISALRRELESGRRAALQAFWAKTKEHGSPLIEPVHNDPEHMLVTVLWRDDTAVKNVGLHWESYAYNDPEQYAFAHLPGSDVWYLTLKLPARARFVYQISPDDDMVPYNRFSPFDESARERHEDGAMPDPLNPHHWIQQNGDFSLAELPQAPPQPWVAEQPGVPRGHVEKKRFKSELLRNEREIAIYTPPRYASSHSPYWLMVLFDERQYLTMVPTPTILDNLIAARKIPPIVAVLVDAIDRETRRRETMGPLAVQYVKAIATELAPWMQRNYNVTHKAAQTILAGSSANGFASIHGAWLHPEVFGNVLCQSGALFWQPGAGLRTGDNPEWLAQQFAANPRKPIRLFVEAGLFEDNREGILDSSRHLRDIATAKGYDIYYQEFAGGHNYINWRGSIADGLIYLTSAVHPSRKRQNK